MKVKVLLPLLLGATGALVSGQGVNCCLDQACTNCPGHAMIDDCGRSGNIYPYEGNLGLGCRASTGQPEWERCCTDAQCNSCTTPDYQAPGNCDQSPFLQKSGLGDCVRNPDVPTDAPTDAPALEHQTMPWSE